jgi:hypothetical protein
MNFQLICTHFEQANQPLLQIHGHGSLALSPVGARIVALSFSRTEDNVFFTNPDLADMATGIAPEALVGGPGGDRLRFAPEYAYAWDSPVPDTNQFSNYHVQRNEDPGAYTMTQNGQEIQFFADTRLVDKRTGDLVRFMVNRRVSPLEDSPITLPDGMRFTGYDLHHTLTAGAMQSGQSIDLWGLIQMPIGSTLLVPVRDATPPMKYFNKGTWTSQDHHIRWTYDGHSNSKIGLSTAQSTGRTGALREMLDGKWVLVIREFPVKQDMHYCDGPDEARSGSQVFQAWDGFGFGEMEYHTPAVGPAPLPDAYEEKSSVWAFEGTPEQINRLVVDLLGIEGD